MWKPRVRAELWTKNALVNAFHAFHILAALSQTLQFNYINLATGNVLNVWAFARALDDVASTVSQHLIPIDVADSMR
jgi:hypothetical protein